MLGIARARGGPYISGSTVCCDSWSEEDVLAMNSNKGASQRGNSDGAKGNLASISPFFIVQDLQASKAGRLCGGRTEMTKPGPLRSTAAYPPC